MSAALDRTFTALSHPPRREIVARLTRGPATIGELRSSFSFTKQAMSKHVAMLEEAGLVEREVRGREHQLRLVKEPLDEAQRWLAERTEAWQANFDRLHDVLGDREEDT